MVPRNKSEEQRVTLKLSPVIIERTSNQIVKVKLAFRFIIDLRT